MYLFVSDGEVKYRFSPEIPVPKQKSIIVNEIFDFVAEPLFPCLGAKSSFNRDLYRIGIYRNMLSEVSLAGLAYDLYNYVLERPSIDAFFPTFIAVFDDEIIETEIDFHTKLWQMLQKLHDLDSAYFSWDPKFSSDTSNSFFGYSFAETAFFLVGLNPKSSRLSRRFKYPCIVFNSHAQFDELRRVDRLDTLTRLIRERDFRLQGSNNPMSAVLGDSPEHRQYSGMAVSEDWKCPLQVSTTNIEADANIDT